MSDARPTRHRLVFAALAAATMFGGLQLQRHRATLPAAVGDILGDALWAVMFYWLVSMVFPALTDWHRAIVAVAGCWSVELSQLARSPGLVALRHTTLGHLVLGSDFDPRDLLVYPCGVAVALLFERLLIARRAP
ncbi:MAG: DUF2809 domain-containing protein [Gemmatimonadales bacterium]